MRCQTLFTAEGGYKLAGRISSLSILVILCTSPLLAFLAVEKELLHKWNGMRATSHAGILVGSKHRQTQSYVTFDRDESFTTAIQSKSFWSKHRETKNSKKLRRASTKRRVQITNARYGLFTSFSTDNLASGKRAVKYRPEKLPNRGTYRTVCVRLCDGYFWPISFATSKSNFRADTRTCKSSCGSPTKLFYYPNPGAEPTDMVDLKGRPYTGLKTAWLYQDNYVGACTCRPHPWQAASKTRHQRYAELQKKGKLKRYLARLSRKERRRLKKLRKRGWSEVASFKKFRKLSKQHQRNSGIVVIAAPPRKKSKTKRSVAAVSPNQKARKVVRKSRSVKRMALGKGTKPALKRVVRRKKKQRWKQKVFGSNR